MQGVIADADFIGAFRRLLQVLHSEEWRPYWESLSLIVSDFEALGLAAESSDRVVWEVCQREQLVLVTTNRNHDGPDSLEEMVRFSKPTSLPVITVADGRRILFDSQYARVIAVDLLDYLFMLKDNPESLLGSGRLYLPKNPV